jgi:hypothetical protein
MKKPMTAVLAVCPEVRGSARVSAVARTYRFALRRYAEVIDRWVGGFCGL